jgi:aconitate hydratase
MYQGRFNLKEKQLNKIAQDKISFWQQLPFSLRILLENALRNDLLAAEETIEKFSNWRQGNYGLINYCPSRVLMQDLTGVPALVDLAAMRDASQSLGADPQKINPLCRVDLVADHSVTVNHFGSSDAYIKNTTDEIKDNQQRYAFLKWAQGAFDGVRIVPPGKGICHQVNLEYLATVVETKDDWVYPDTLVGLDSHTTMINGLAVLGWGVGGIEAEAAMLGQPIRMVLPKVVGVELKGNIQEGVTATDVVLALTQFLRGMNVVGCFVEFYGQGLKDMDLATRATIANMAPEFGATCAFFPADEKTLEYLQLSGRSQEHINLVEAYLKDADLFYDLSNQVTFTQQVIFDLDAVVSCVAGPLRPEQMLPVSELKNIVQLPNAKRDVLSDASVVIAAITSCTNTSNPSVLIAAGLVAQKARARGLTVPDWVKTSMAPGSRVVMQYLSELGLDQDLASLGFHLVGYGCTTCIGNSGPLEDWVAEAITKQDLKVSAVLSGNRNFEGRVHPQTQMNYLASPPLVVIYALAGTTVIDISRDPIAYTKDQQPIFLKDLWPTQAEINHAMQSVRQEMFLESYQDILDGTEAWDEILTSEGHSYHWDESSTYIQMPPFLQQVSQNVEPMQDVVNAHVLAYLGDSVTTDHISPAGHIPHLSAAGLYLTSKGVDQSAFNSYGSRRGNAEVMVRGTLANIRLQNKLVAATGGLTRHIPTGEEMSIYDAAMRYQKDQTPLVIIAGESYGVGSSRDWAAKGVMLLGVKVVIAKSFERIHRTNLIGMGVLPCVFKGQAPELNGSEQITVSGIASMSEPNTDLVLSIAGYEQQYVIQACLQTDAELSYYKHGGILPYVLRQQI